MLNTHCWATSLAQERVEIVKEMIRVALYNRINQHRNVEALPLRQGRIQECRGRSLVGNILKPVVEEMSRITRAVDKIRILLSKVKNAAFLVLCIHLW